MDGQGNLPRGGLSLQGVWQPSGWNSTGSVGAAHGGYLSVQMGSLGSERRLRVKPLGQMIEKTAVPLAPGCRTWRTSLPWPYGVCVHSGPLAALLLDSMVVGLWEPRGFGRASPRCSKIGAMRTRLGRGGETAGHFCATSQKHPHVLHSWHHLWVFLHQLIHLPL